MFKYAGLLLSCLVLCLAGCSTTPPDNQPPATWTSPNAQPAPVAPAPLATNHIASPTNNLTASLITNGIAQVVPPPPPAPVKPLPPPVTQVTNLDRPVVQFNPPPVVVSKPVMTFTSLNRWAEQHEMTPPQRIAGSAMVRYAVGSPRGVIVLEIGGLEATWNGVVVHLAFAPEIIDDQVFVHGLDLEKTFSPLLCESSPALATNAVIVIDPGHGGINGGTVSSVDGQPEKTFTLDWARRLAPLLAAKGWHVILTRTNDADIAVTNRVNFAVANHADLFLSLHFNSAAPDHKQAGLETYCLTPTGMSSTITRGYPDLAWQTFPANTFDNESLLLAVRLHKAILRATGEEDRGVRRARFLGVLRGQQCPCVLIEGGYLSNLHEAQEIENAEYRQKLAVAVAGAISPAALAK